MTDSLAQDLSGGPLISALSNELVQLYRKHYGRGPTQTRTVVLDDMIVRRMTHRKVIAHVSGVHTDPDLSVNVFMLAPPDGD